MHINNRIPGLLSALLVSALPCGLFAQAGSLDVTFDGDGVLIQDFTSWPDVAFDVALQSDGKIVTVGYVHLNGGAADFAVMRHLPDGSLDPGFGIDGRQATDILGGDFATSVAIQPDGRIVVAGHIYVPQSKNISSVVARYLTDGTLDSSFGGDGAVIINYTGGSYRSAANAVAIQPDGKIVLAGGADIGFSTHFVLARFNTYGSLDNSFSSDGKVNTNLGDLNGSAMAIALQPDGRIVVAGFAYDGTDDDVAVQRYNTDGTLDTSFDGDGKVITDLGPGGFLPRAMALQPDGKIVVAGTANYVDFALVRYNTDGTLDTGFDDDGRVTTVVSVLGAQAWSVALQPDGRIVTIGFANSGLGYDFAVVRHNTDGTLDTGFDSDGMVLTDMTAHDEGHAVVLQPDGKILVAGQSYNGTDVNFTLVRYLSDLSTGLIDLSGHDRSVLVYPNPMEDEAVLQYALSKEETISIRLLDLEGRVLHTFIENRVRGAGEHRQKIALPQGLASGTYMLSVSSLTGQVSIRIVR